MMEGALVLPPISVGMIDASATRKPSMPRTRNSLSTTACSSLPGKKTAFGDGFEIGGSSLEDDADENDHRQAPLGLCPS